MSLIQAAITATAQVADFTNDLALNLFTRETDRVGTALIAHKENNYLNFVVPVTTFTNAIDIIANADAADEDTTVFTFTDAGNAVANACVLYDLKFTSGTNAHDSINISDFVTLSNDNVEETKITFSGNGVTGGTIDGGDLTNAGTVALSVAFSSDSAADAVSTNISYAVANTLSITATKEDNVLAADIIAWDTEPNDPADNAADILSASKGFDAFNGSKTVTGSVTGITITSSNLTNAIQKLVDSTGEGIADKGEIAAVRSALNDLATDTDGATFKGIVGADGTASLTVGSELGSNSKSTALALTPQIFFHEYKTNGAALAASAAAAE